MMHSNISALSKYIQKSYLLPEIPGRQRSIVSNNKYLTIPWWLGILKDVPWSSQDIMSMYLQFLATCHKKEIVPGRICKTTLLETIKSVYEY